MNRNANWFTYMHLCASIAAVFVLKSIDNSSRRYYIYLNDMTIYIYMYVYMLWYLEYYGVDTKIIPYHTITFSYYERRVLLFLYSFLVPIIHTHTRKKKIQKARRKDVKYEQCSLNSIHFLFLSLQLTLQPFYVEMFKL